MKFTIDWLKQHLDTNYSDEKIVNKLTNIGLEVESFESQLSDKDEFIVAKIVNSEQHPNADRLSVCDVDIGNKEIVKVVCGAPNAKKNLLTIYAPPGAIIPKNQMKLSVSKIRGVTSHGMLCSESELKLSDESEGITELPSKKYNSQIGKKYFKNNSSKIVDLSITPNRADCLGVKGIARDLVAAGVGKFKRLNKKKIQFKGNQKIKVKIIKEKNQGCFVFGSCLIRGIKNTESPQWLKDKIIALGQKPISAIVDITNYIMFDLNRPLHAYDADKINESIIVRNSKKGENFQALDNKEYKLQDNMCVISDKSGVLGLGGIIGGIRSGTELDTKNILLESAYFDPKSIRKTAKLLNIDTDAKYRFERGIDPESTEEGLINAAKLIQEICGGEISKLNIQISKISKKIPIKFPLDLFQKTTGFKVVEKEMIKILTDLGFVIKKKSNHLNLIIPSWRPDISQPIDIVEEIVRIKGYDQIKTVLPEKLRKIPTLNKQQKLFHFLQRSVASKGYYETVTWSFTDSKINQFFKEDKNEVEIVNPISSDLNVLRSSIFSNLIIYLKKNLDRGFKDISLFEIGPIFKGNKPGQPVDMINIKVMTGHDTGDGSDMLGSNLACQNGDDKAILTLTLHPLLVLCLIDGREAHRHTHTMAGKQHILEYRGRFRARWYFHHHPQRQGVMNHRLTYIQHIDIVAGKKIGDGGSHSRLVGPGYINQQNVVHAQSFQYQGRNLAPILHGTTSYRKSSSRCKLVTNMA